MDNQYENVAKIIKSYLEDNNLGNFTKTDDEEKYQKFYNEFSPDILASLDAKDARDKIFMHDGDKNNLCYVLESSPDYKFFCGSIKGGTSYKFTLFKKKTGQWTTGSSKSNKAIDEEESISLAVRIRDAIVEGAHCITESNLNDVDDYIKLGKSLKEIFKDSPVNPDNSWIHKYYSIIFPEFIPPWHNDLMKKDMIKRFHLKPLKDYFANDGQLFFLSKTAGIKFYSLFDEEIVRLFYKWDGDLWTDSFDKRKLLGNPNITYWAYTPGTNANKWDFCYKYSVIGVGWNYLGDLSKYEDNFDELLVNKIKKTEKLKSKPTSAVRSLSGIYKNIQAGDIICVRDGLSKIIAIGEVTPDSKYIFDKNMDDDENPYDRFYHIRTGINWKVLDEAYTLKGNKFLRDTLYDLKNDKVINIIKQLSDNLPESEMKDTSSLSRNIIYFGAPGTGKSYTLNKDVENLVSSDEYYERVTFHPDYSYAKFVGTYKPVSTDDAISYDYVPGPFMRTLVKALKNPYKNYLLVIEEINRAKVAAVFGDIFQLLDRKKSGESRYPIETSEDIRKYLKNNLGKTYNKMSIPSNMFIWATMNSADQGVFPMDTAFKRRWNFKYFAIDNNEELIENIVVDLNGIQVSWNDLRKAINDELLNYKVNEDKLLGPFFAYDEYLDGDISDDEFKEIFKNKVLMYLFEDVARSKRNILFSGVGEKNNRVYSRICDEFDEKGVEIFCNNIRDQFINEDEE